MSAISTESLTKAQLIRRISEIEDSLARPDEEPGPEWDRRRWQLQNELTARKRSLAELRA